MKVFLSELSDFQVMFEFPEVEAVYPEPGRYEEKYADYEAEYYDNDVFKNKEPNEEDILEDLDTICNDVVEDFDLRPEITRSE